MSIHTQSGACRVSQAISLALQERRHALSAREWKHRLAGYGYGIKETARGAILTELVGGRELATLPGEGTA